MHQHSQLARGDPSVNQLVTTQKYGVSAHPLCMVEPQNCNFYFQEKKQNKKIDSYLKYVVKRYQLQTRWKIKVIV